MPICDDRLFTALTNGLLDSRAALAATSSGQFVVGNHRTYGPAALMLNQVGKVSLPE